MIIEIDIWGDGIIPVFLRGVTLLIENFKKWGKNETLS